MSEINNYQDSDACVDVEREKELFYLALEVEDPEKRSDWVKKACGEDEELHLRLNGLLAAEGTEGIGFLKPKEDRLGAVVAEIRDQLHTGIDAPGVDDLAGPGPVKVVCHEKPGDIIGRYKLLEKVGEGGCGVVYMAEQTKPVRRRVALKIIKLGMDTRQVVARFEAERQVVAMMAHPNITNILDAGATDSGRPYFVMELIHGSPITTFCDEYKLGTRARLELFLQVCAAVQHAHQKGFIHRDIKPGNVLVTILEGQPVSKVIDFGISKSTQLGVIEEGFHTRQGDIIGTPVYMSPEQASMNGSDIDIRSDIYALGVLLYELLAGAPPFDHKSLLSVGHIEMCRIIAEDDPPKPSTRFSETCHQASTATVKESKLIQPYIRPSSLKGDLDWVVMKALEKDRTRRYESANALAADIQRYLADVPVLAVAPSYSHRFKKFVSRNKAGFWIAATIVIMMLAGISTTSWQALLVIRESKRATDAELRVLEESQVKVAALEAEEAMTRIVADMLSDSSSSVKIPPDLRAKCQRISSREGDVPERSESSIPLQEKSRSDAVFPVWSVDPEMPPPIRILGDFSLDAGRPGVDFSGRR